jgi:hypothetical protein
MPFSWAENITAGGRIESDSFLALRRPVVERLFVLLEKSVYQWKLIFGNWRVKFANRCDRVS